MLLKRPTGNQIWLLFNEADYYKIKKKYGFFFQFFKSLSGVSSKNFKYGSPFFEITLLIIFLVLKRS